MITRALTAAVLAALALAPAPAGSGAAEPSLPPHLQPAFLASIEDAQLHGTITPPGADTQHATSEIAAYDDLVQGYPKLTMDELQHRYFKTRLFGAPLDAGRTYEPRAGVTVVRDSQWGEPHIFGATDGDMAFGAGWVAAEDRLPIMELLRALGRAEAFQLLGTTPAWLADMEMARLYGYTEEEWQAQLDRLPRVYGKPGADIVAMIDEYVKGINAYVTATGQTTAPWKPTDVVAAVSTVRALFGAGGGSEMNDAAVLAGLDKDFGPRLGREIYEDFRSRDNADGPVHTTRPFPYELRDPAAIDPRSVAVDTSGAGSSAAQLAKLAEQARIHWERLKLTTPYGTVNLSHPNSMSNHLAIGASRTTNGRPLLIGGPQAGYFSPEILMDYEIHSPTIHARGAGFPGLSTIVVMGRTQDYAWSPTAGGSDMIDTYVEKLCDPNGGTAGEDSHYYEFNGKCIAMDRRTLRQAPPDAPYPDLIVERTVHGPVLARTTLNGLPVAVSQKRSSYGKEIDAAVSILKMNRDEARTGQDFVSIFRESHNLSTNWSYVNDHEIAYVHGGLYPIRPKAVDPDLPVWGTGQWEWKTDEHGDDVYLGREQVPYEVAPKRDYFVSWNNRPAPHWNGSDAQWGWSSIYRAKLLEDQILAQKPHSIDPVRLVQMMETAGLTDLRGHYVLPLALRVLESASGIGPRERKMIDLLRGWVADGSLRRDGDGNGGYDDSAAVAIMDAWWERLIRAVYDPVIGDAARIPLPFDNAPSSGGSAYQDGFYGYLWTDFSQVLGDPVKSPTSRIYCGGSRAANGALGECAKRVLASLRAAGDQLASDQDTDDPAQWKSDAEGERIRFLPAAALSMHWVNRPTTQQIAMFGRLARAPVLRLTLRYRRGRRGCAAGRVRATLGGRDFRRVEKVMFAVSGRRPVSDRRAPFTRKLRLRRGGDARVRASAELRGGSAPVVMTERVHACR
jgi:acyl-homoserine lactone acylase PvdQ